MENGLTQPSFEYFVILLVKSGLFLINLFVSIRIIINKQADCTPVSEL